MSELKQVIEELGNVKMDLKALCMGQSHMKEILDEVRVKVADVHELRYLKDADKDKEERIRQIESSLQEVKVRVRLMFAIFGSLIALMFGGLVMKATSNGSPAQVPAKIMGEKKK